MGSDAPLPSNSRNWPRLLAFAGWGIAGVVAYRYLPVSATGRLILMLLWIAGIGILARDFILSLFGPVLSFDLLRVGRRPRFIWFRVVYAIVIFVVFAFIYLSWYEFASRRTDRIPLREQTRLAEMIFSTFMVIQFILAAVLTPAMVAGTIADEKERRTLEFILATDLRDREILFGKLASRVGALLLFLVAGMPILAFMQFFGGIDPDLVIAGFLATVVTILSLAALSIACSVLARKARDAIALTYLGAIAFLAVSGILCALSYAPGWRGPHDLFGYVFELKDVTYPLWAGNTFIMVVMAQEQRGGAVRFDGVYDALGDYALAHLTLMVLFLLWAGFRLRSIALRQEFGGGKRLKTLSDSRPVARPGEPTPSGPPRKRGLRRFLPKRRRPEIGDDPILWKEVFVDSGLKLGWVALICGAILVLLSFFPAILIIQEALFTTNTWRPRGDLFDPVRWEILARDMNAFARYVGAPVSALIFLTIAVRGSSSILGERDKHSLDVLFTTPLSAKRILWGKWWGCMLGQRFGWIWLISIWFLAMALGGLNPIMIIPLVVATAIYASGFAWIGIWCSLTCRTSLRATIFSILIALTAGGGYFLFFVFCCGIPMSFMNVRSRDFDVGIDVLAGFSPVVGEAFLPIYRFEGRESELASKNPFFPFCLLGLIAWFCVSLFLSNNCLGKLRKMANRVPATRAEPEGSRTFAPPE
jgi:ABC-type transport system involved in multi-copper enzyme maturation permease subunit